MGDRMPYVARGRLRVCYELSVETQHLEHFWFASDQQLPGGTEFVRRLYSILLRKRTARWAERWGEKAREKGVKSLSRATA